MDIYINLLSKQDQSTLMEILRVIEYILFIGKIND